MIGLLALSATACGDSDDDTGRGGDDGGTHTGTDAGDTATDSGSTPPPAGSVAFTGVIREALAPMDGDAAVPMDPAPLEGWKWCLLNEPDNCSITDAGGAFSLDVPASSNVAVSGSKQGWPSILRIFATGSSDYSVEESYLHQEVYDQFVENSGVTLQDDLGVIGFFLGGPGGGGVSLDPDSGSLVWAVGETGLPDTDASSAPGGVTDFGSGSIGWIMNVEPGEYEMSYQTPDAECTAGMGTWMGSTASSHGTAAAAGHFTWGSFATCMGDPTFTDTHDSYADAAACEADTDATATDACQACTCGNCLLELNDCRAAAGCYDIVQCAGTVQCSGMDCYAPDTCQEELDGVPGGLGGASAGAATALSDCTTANCPADCPQPN
jgi:hypothetical protein